MRNDVSEPDTSGRTKTQPPSGGFSRFRLRGLGKPGNVLKYDQSDSLRYPAFHLLSLFVCWLLGVAGELGHSGSWILTAQHRYSNARRPGHRQCTAVGVCGEFRVEVRGAAGFLSRGL